MTCKIKGGVLYDDNFMSAFAEIMEGIALPYTMAFKMYKVGNALGLAHRDIDEKKQAIIERHAKKNNEGRFKRDNNNNFMFGDKRKVEEEVIALLSKDIELDCDLIDLKDLEEGVLKPTLIHSLAMLSPILKKEV